MMKNYFKIAWRNLTGNKIYASINIIGLAVSLTACILILLYVQDEFSFDTFNKNTADLYKVNVKFGQAGKEDVWENTTAPIAFLSKKNVPEVQNACRVATRWDITKVEYDNKKFYGERVGIADTSLFTMFSFPLVSGDVTNIFPDDLSVVISETTANKFFGTANPIGKIIRTDDNKDCHVTAVMKDMPVNSSIQYDMIFSFDLLKRNYDGKGFWKSADEDWGSYNYLTFLLLKPGSDPNAVARKITQVHIDARGVNEFTKSLHYLMQPLLHVHLYRPDGSDGGMMIVRIFFIIAIIILSIACINYVNLVTARSAKRAKEISMRKIIGAGKMSLFWQFLSESLLIFLASLLVATVLIFLIMPVYNDIAGKNITFNPLNKDVLAIYGIALLTTLTMAGIYPAVALSSLNPLEAMKGKISAFGTKGTFRKVLVVIQFTFSIIFIVSTIVIGRQLKYIREMNLGYDKENVFTINLKGIGDHYDAAKDNLLKLPGVQAVTASGGDLLNSGATTGDVDWSGREAAQHVVFTQIPIERNFLDVLGIKLTQGAGFTGTAADTVNYILNETAVLAMGIKDPIGKQLVFNGTKGFIVGVTKDFNFNNLHNKITPAVMYYSPGRRDKMYVKTTAKDAPGVIAETKKIWDGYNLGYSFEFSFLDDSFNSMYNSDIRVGKLFNCFAVITILISCLGLFGLVTYTAESKVREIGVRKALGATTLNIVRLLANDFLKLILIATAIAFPIASWGLNRYLQVYAYRADLSWWIFVLAGAITLAVALVTISFQAIKAALANPVKSLRTV